VQLSSGRWISEKDPGYPFLAAPFQWLGIIRLAPLLYGALGCLGLFFGARRWLGRFGGSAAVALFCSSGAALLSAWQDYWPTFTDASLIAAGTGALVWMVLADGAAARRRTWVGLLGFLAIEAAAFVRYTDIVVLGCAVVAVLVVRWRRAASVPRGALRWWLGSVALFAAGVAVFDYDRDVRPLARRRHRSRGDGRRQQNPRRHRPRRHHRRQRPAHTRRPGIVHAGQAPRRRGREENWRQTIHDHDARRSRPARRCQLDGFWANLTGWRLLLTLSHSGHYSYTDDEEFLSQLVQAGIVPPSRASQVITPVIGTIDPGRAVAAERAYVGAFFDLHLRHRAGDLLDRPSLQYPDIQFIAT
jgi:hypothetical protein